VDAQAVNGVAATVQSVALSAPRLVSLFIVLPVFGRQATTRIVRNGFAIMLAVFVAPAVQHPALAEIVSGLTLLITAKEVLIGLLMALCFGPVLWALQNAGHLIDYQAGWSNAGVYDPISGTEDGPAAGFLNHLAVALFLFGGGFQVMVGWTLDSFRLWPVESMLPDVSAALGEFAITQADTMLVATTKIASAVTLVLVLAELGLGLVSRSAPQLNVFTVAPPLKSGLAVLMMVLLLQLVVEAMGNILAGGAGLKALIGAVH
jgi:type III secretion protein T